MATPIDFPFASQRRYAGAYEAHPHDQVPMLFGPSGSLEREVDGRRLLGQSDWCGLQDPWVEAPRALGCRPAGRPCQRRRGATIAP